MLILILGVIFVILKMAGAIAWSWWWVCSPFLAFLVVNFVMSLLVIANGVAQGLTMEEIMENIRKSGKM